MMLVHILLNVDDLFDVFMQKYKWIFLYNVEKFELISFSLTFTVKNYSILFKIFAPKIDLGVFREYV